MTHILKPLPDPLPDDVSAVLAAYPKQDGYILQLFRTFANGLRFLKKGVPNLLDRESPLTLRERELVILRVAAIRGCEYEWGVHVAAFQRAAGLTDAQVAATCDPDVDLSLWSDTEALLLTCIGQLCDRGRMDDQTRDRFEATWTVEQQLEIFALGGAYHTVCFVANTARLPREPFAASFPRRSSPPAR